MTLSTAPTPSPTAYAHLADDLGSFDSHLPLDSTPALDARVRQLVPCAVQRQLWLLLFDADDVQMPIMIPIGDLPLRTRTADGEGLVELLSGLVREFQVASFVFVVERPGPAELRLSDRHWLHFLLHAATSEHYRVRRAYLGYSDGVIGYDSDDVIGLSGGHECSRCDGPRG